MSLAPGVRLGPYEIHSAIGAGGMGIVYRALDTKLNRPVAIKFLSDELANPAARRRFQREAQAASSLNHPHIITVHDAGEFQGRQYLVTEFIDGGTLRDWVPQQHDWRQTLELLIGVADGLASAHEAGILHRDIKPENILITKSGYAKLADFGLAKLHEASSPDEELTRTVTDMRTRPGVVMGTLAYMSPEQAAGLPLDARSDIYSFGVVLYEVLAGHRPYIGPMPEGIPPAIRRIVAKALEPDAASRFPTMRDMVGELREAMRTGSDAPVAASVPPRGRQSSRTVAVALFVAGLAASAFVAWVYRPRSLEPTVTTSGAQIRSIAVLPLENRSGDPEQDYFVEGMHEALITDLARIGLNKVIAKASADTFKGTKKSLSDIGRELSVDGLVTGSVMRVNDRVHVTTQLVRADGGAVVWANRYDRSAGDVLSLQNALVTAIAQELRATLTTEQSARLAQARPVHPDAHEAYLKARAMFGNFTNRPDTKLLAAAIAEFERAIQIDPTYAPSYAALSRVYESSSEGSWLAPKDAFPKARAAALKAVELDDRSAAAHAALGGVFLWYDWNWSGAEREIKRALELSPDSPDALTQYEVYQTLVADDRDGAARTSQRILDVDPLNPFSRLQPIWISFFTRRYDDSIAHAKSLLDVQPNNLMSPWFLASNYAMKGMAADVVAQCDRVMAILSGGYMMQPIAACVGELGRVGRTAEARRLLEKLEHPPADIWLDPVPMGEAFAGLGDVNRAVEWYRRGLEERSPNMIYLKVSPFADPVRGDPRFQELLRQMNFP
jgi:serine/threonine-protein kinase